MMHIIKKIVKKPINTFGYDLVEKKRPGNKNTNSIPILCDNMLDALHSVQGGIRASFLCPLTLCTHRIGINFQEKGWHPFVETLREYSNNTNLRYEDSSLKLYYDRWQPDNAYQAYIGFQGAPDKFKTLPPYLFYLSPWSARSIKWTDKSVRNWHKDDDTEHGNESLNMDVDGFRDFGPVSKDKGLLEFNRLINVYQSIERDGFDRKYGDINILVLKRNQEYRYLHQGGGYHRAAAMIALGHTEIPATFFCPWIISLKDINHWPHVRSGIWNRKSAQDYFNHLFDFNNRTWAEKNILRDR